MEAPREQSTSPAAEAVDHVRFQLSLLRLCSVPDLAQSVKPEWIADHRAETEQTLELEFLTEVAR